MPAVGPDDSAAGTAKPAAATRREREAMALRANLLRRKHQGRVRAQPEADANACSGDGLGEKRSRTE
jgi:hypothetical protein